MRDFEQVSFDVRQCHRELDDFHTLLRSNQELSEKHHIRGFFRKNRQLTSLLGIYAGSGPANHISYEFDVAGQFRADIAVGNRRRVNTYCMIELESGTGRSIFSKRRPKHTTEWSPRYNHGFSQLVDWFYHVDNDRESAWFKNSFGDDALFYGLLVIGRSSAISEGDRHRWKWRQEHVLVDGKEVRCLTYDELGEDLSIQLGEYLKQVRLAD
jgi:hypothetical protein